MSALSAEASAWVFPVTGGEQAAEPITALVPNYTVSHTKVVVLFEVWSVSDNGQGAVCNVRQGGSKWFGCYD